MTVFILVTQLMDTVVVPLLYGLMMNDDSCNGTTRLPKLIQNFVRSPTSLRDLLCLLEYTPTVSSYSIDMIHLIFKKYMRPNRNVLSNRYVPDYERGMTLVGKTSVPYQYHSLVVHSLDCAVQTLAIFLVLMRVSILSEYTRCSLEGTDRIRPFKISSSGTFVRQLEVRFLDSILFIFPLFSVSVQFKRHGRLFDR